MSAADQQELRDRADQRGDRPLFDALGACPRFSVLTIDPEAVKDWPAYQKRVTTKAIRIPGPFEVETSEGVLRCADGYLAIDARGYPYPIAADEFELIYAPVTDAQP